MHAYMQLLGINETGNGDPPPKKPTQRKPSKSTAPKKGK